MPIVLGLLAGVVIGILMDNLGLGIALGLLGGSFLILISAKGSDKD